MIAKRITPIAIALGLLGMALLVMPAQAQSFRGHTCKNLWEHVNTGGYVMYEQTNRWFYSSCPERDAPAGGDDENDEPASKPTVVTCAYLPPRVAVFGHVRGTQCQMVGDVVISMQPGLHERGFIDAVDVWSYVNGGIEVCFRNEGWLVFLDAAYSPRMVNELAHFYRDGMTCGAIDRAGTVVLLRDATPSSASPIDAAPVTLPVFDSIPQSICQIKLQETLFLRAEPAGEIIGLVWLFSEVPVFEINGDWYKIEFQGATGYISRFYSRVLHGGCI